MPCSAETTTRCDACVAWPRSPSVPARAGSSSAVRPPISVSPTPSITGPEWPCSAIREVASSMPRCGPVVMDMLAPFEPSPTGCSPWPARCSKAAPPSTQTTSAPRFQASPEAIYKRWGVPPAPLRPDNALSLGRGPPTSRASKSRSDPVSPWPEADVRAYQERRRCSGATAVPARCGSAGRAKAAPRYSRLVYCSQRGKRRDERA
jgi:hypothetical protein